MHYKRLFLPIRPRALRRARSLRKSVHQRPVAPHLTSRFGKNRRSPRCQNELSQISDALVSIPTTLHLARPCARITLPTCLPLRDRHPVASLVIFQFKRSRYFTSAANSFTSVRRGPVQRDRHRVDSELKLPHSSTRTDVDPITMTESYYGNR